MNSSRSTPRRWLALFTGFGALWGASVYAADEWVNMATVSMTNATTPKLTANGICYTDGTDIACNNPSTAITTNGQITAGSGLFNGGLTVTGQASITTVSTSILQLNGTAALTCNSSISGSIRYNSTSNTLQICTGTGWASLSSGTSAGVTALASLTDVSISNVAGRDYLRYDSVSSKWLNISESTAMSTTTMVSTWPDAVGCTSTSPNIGYNIFYLVRAPNQSSIYIYRQVTDGGTGYEVQFNADGSYSNDLGLTTHNCNVSISSLYAAGRAFNFIGNSGSTGGSALGDRITSGTSAVTVNSATSTISFTTANVVTSYMDSTGRLITPGISVTTNQLSGTTGYFSRYVHVSANAASPSLQLTGDNAEEIKINSTAPGIRFRQTDVSNTFYMVMDGEGLGFRYNSTGTLPALSMTSNGVVIGNYQGNASLTVVSGEIQTGSSGMACGLSLGGAIRYAASTLTYCNGTSWTTIAGGSGGTPGGSSNQVQYNNGGAFAADGNFTYTSSTGTISATRISATNVSATYASIIYGSMDAVAANSISVSTLSGTLIQAGTSSATCTSSISGSIRYNTTSNTLQVCTGTGWVSLSSGTTSSALGDRITSGTSAVTVNSGTSTISFTTANVVTSYIDSTGRLIAPGISVTTNQLSATTGYFSQAVGIGTANPSGTAILEVSGTTGTQVNLKGTGTGIVALEMGTDTTNNHYAYIDFVGDTTYTDYGLRIIRNNTGSNTTSLLTHRGTGEFQLTTNDAAPIVLSTNSAERMRINSQGTISFTNAIQTAPSSLTCTSSISGSIRYSATSSTIQVCNGTGWAALTTGAGTSPGGATTQVQFNDNGSFNGTASFTYTSSTGRISITEVSASTISATRGQFFQSVSIGISGTSAPGMEISSAASKGGLGLATAGTQYSSVAAANDFTVRNLRANLILAAINPTGSIIFTTSGTAFAGNGDIERMRIVSTGNVGIGTATPTTSLEVDGTISATGISSSYLTANSIAGGNLNSVNISATGAIQIPQTSASCASGISGSIRYNTTSNTLQICTGSGWASLSSGTSGGGGGTPGGATTQVQFNDNSSFNGTAGFTYTSGTGLISVTAISTSRIGIGTSPNPNTSHSLAILSSGDITAISITAPQIVNAGLIDIFGASSTGVGDGKILGIRTISDTTARFMVYSDGKIGWGSGNATRDTFLSRATSSTLRISSDAGTGSAALQVMGTISTTNAVQIGTSSLTCNSSISGSIRYSTTSSTIEYCNSTAWVSMGPSATAPIAFFVHKNGTSQTITTGANVKLTWSTEDYDTNNNFASDTFTPTMPGYYYIRLQLATISTAAGNYSNAKIYKNGSEIAFGSFDAPNSNSVMLSQVDTLVYMNGTTDYIEAYINSSNSPVWSTKQRTAFMGYLVSPQSGGSGGGGTPGGSSDQVQYNSGGSFAGDANFTYSGGTISATRVSATNVSATYASIIYGSMDAVAANSISVSTLSGTLIQAGTSSATCTSSISGSIRYNTTSNTLQICTGTGWVSLSSGTTGGGGTPGGATTQVQYNNGGSFSADSNFTYTSSTGTVAASVLAANYTSSSRISATMLQLISTSTVQACSSSISGSLRFNTTSNTLQICTGTGWASLSSGTTGGGAAALNDLSDVSTSTSAGSMFIGLETGLGQRNTSLGISASSAITANGTDNTFIGYRAGLSTTSGDSNTAVGVMALASNTTGLNNVALGNEALASNVNGAYNVALGVMSLYSNVSGSTNTAMGDQALFSNTGGQGNVALGNGVMFDNTMGNANVAAGEFALTFNTTGNENIALGYAAMNRNIDGYSNIGVGPYALYENVNGNSNIAIGYDSLAYTTTNSNNVAIGAYAGQGDTGTQISNSVLIGYAAGEEITSAQDLVFIGYSAGTLNETGSYNVAVGNLALSTNTAGTYNTAIGDRALANSTANYNTGVGGYALVNNSSGSANTAVGREAMRSNTSGSYNSALGSQAGYFNNGDRNAIMGYGAVFGSSGNTIVSESVILGYQAGYAMTTAERNVILGSSAGNTITTGDSNILIGYNVQASSATASNELNIGNAIRGNLSLGSISLTNAIQIGQSSLTCSNSISGSIRYNTSASSTLQICNGASWVGMGSGGGGGGASVLTDLTDVSATSPAHGAVLQYISTTTQWTAIPVSQAMSTSTIEPGIPDAIRCQSEVMDGEIIIPLLSVSSTGGYLYGNLFISQVQFDNSGNFVSQTGVTPNCDGLSISDLYSQGRAFNFIGGIKGDQGSAGTGDDNIASNTTIVSVRGSSSYISLSTAGTTWGYLSSATSYLPFLNTAQVSTTNISASYATLYSLAADGIASNIVSTSYLSGTLIQAGASGASCVSGLNGAIRYSATSGTLQICTGTGWASLASGTTGGGGTPGGATTQVQYNDAGSFNGSANFTFTSASGGISVTRVSATMLQLISTSTVQACSSGISGSLRYNTTSNTLQICTGTGWASLSSSTSSGGSGDAITSSTSNVTVNGTMSTISITTAGTVTSYFDSVGRLIAPGISVTTNRLSATTGYFSARVGIATTPPTVASGFALSVSGTAEFTSSTTAYAYLYPSDERLKNDIKPIDQALEKLMLINPASFRFNKEGTTGQVHLGVIAQEVEKVYPQAVTTGTDGYKKVDYPSLIAPLWQATRELNTELNNLKATNTMLLQRLEALERKAGTNP